MRVTVVSLYANPIHCGHLDYIEAAVKMGNYVIAIVNNDHQVKLKGSQPFMNVFFERMTFANGGDRKEGGVPEDVLEEELGIGIAYGLGGDKTQSSSDLLKNSGLFG